LRGQAEIRPKISTAGNAHVAADAWAVMARSMMKSWPFGFRPMAAIDRGREQVVVERGPQRLAQIGGILMAEAGVQRARCR